MDSSQALLQYLQYHPNISRQEITEGIGFTESDATIKRLISKEIEKGNIIVEGKARATRYCLSAQAQLTMPLDIDTYFLKDTDDRVVLTSFNFELITDQLPKVKLFSAEEMQRLNAAQSLFKNILPIFQNPSTARRWNVWALI